MRRLSFNIFTHFGSKLRFCSFSDYRIYSLNDTCTFVEGIFTLMFDFSNYNRSHFEYMVHIFYLPILNDGWYSYPNFSRFFTQLYFVLLKNKFILTKWISSFEILQFVLQWWYIVQLFFSFLLCILINRCIALFSKTCINFSLLANVIRIARNLIYSDTSKNFTNIK